MNLIETRSVLFPSIGRYIPSALRSRAYLRITQTRCISSLSSSTQNVQSHVALLIAPKDFCSFRVIVDVQRHRVNQNFTQMDIFKTQTSNFNSKELKYQRTRTAQVTLDYCEPGSAGLGLGL